MQFQADLLDRTIRRPQNRECTALGAAFLAGLAVGFWEDTKELEALRADDDTFGPTMERDQAEALLAGWAKAVERTIG